jgi:hypothetical protein
MMVRRFIIESCNEPRGAGNGWELCCSEVATGYAVWCIWEDDEDEFLRRFDTIEAAQEFISKLED